MALSGGWSIQPDDWVSLRSTLKGTKWKSTWLEQLYQDSVPESAGVYMISVAEGSMTDLYNLPPDLSTVVYVGRSSNLRQRFRQHGSNRARRHLVYRYHLIFKRLKFVYTLVTESVDLTAEQWTSRAERSLIVALDPPANQNIPTAKPLIGRIGQPQPAT